MQEERTRQTLKQNDGVRDKHDERQFTITQ
jgi:hypothetical protein